MPAMERCWRNRLITGCTACPGPTPQFKPHKLTNSVCEPVGGHNWGHQDYWMVWLGNKVSRLA